MYADFSSPAVTPQMYIGDAGAGFEECLEFLESAKLISLTGDDDSKFKLAGMTPGLGGSRPDRAFPLMVMIVVMPASGPVLMVSVVIVIMIVTMTAFRAVLMLGFVIKG